MNPNIFDVLTVEFGSLKNLSEQLGLSYGAIYAWKTRGQKIPLKNVARIEELSNMRITRQMMRPDKFNANA